MSEQQLPTKGTDRPLPAPQDPNVVLAWMRELLRQVQLAWRLLLDPRISWINKLIPPAALVYILSPIDIIPDFTLGLGQLDDIAILLLGVKLFIDLAPPEIVQEHLRALGAKIDEWRGEEGPVVEGEVVDQPDNAEQETTEQAE